MNACHSINLFIYSHNVAIFPPTELLYFMRTIESSQDCIDLIQEATDDLLLPTLFGQTEPLPSDLRQLVTLSPAKGGLGIPDLQFEAPKQFAASTSITASHDSVTTRSMFMMAGENSIEELKRETDTSNITTETNDTETTHHPSETTRNETELSKYIWILKNASKPYGGPLMTLLQTVKQTRS